MSTVKYVVAVLEDLTNLYAAPTVIRSDNGPDLIAQTLEIWHKERCTATIDIESGSPWQSRFPATLKSRIIYVFLTQG